MSDIALSDRSLVELEAVIERGLTTFVEVGQALLVIRDERKYLETHQTFQDYCRERWGFSRIHAHRLIEAAEVVSVLPIGNTPNRESQARELARLPEPEAVREVWAEVTEEHGDAVTAADVRQAVDRRLGIERRPAYVPPCDDCGQSLIADHGCPMARIPRDALLNHVEQGTEVREDPPVAMPADVFFPEFGYAETIADHTGVEHVTYPMPLPAPISDDDVIEAAGGDEDGRVRVARIRAAYSAGVRATLELIALNPNSVAEVLAPHQFVVARSFTRDVRAWCDRLDSSMDRGIRLVGTEASHG